jgi:hypothetical protein
MYQIDFEKKYNKQFILYNDIIYRTTPVKNNKIYN